MKASKIITIFLLIIVVLPIIYVLISMLIGSTKLFVVLSESMVPVMFIGDGILVEHKEPLDIRVGDIIAFNIDKKIVSHRVVEIYRYGNGNENGNDISFQTKGDNVEKKDPFIVNSKDIIGKATFKIPYVGYLTKYSKKPIWFLIFTIVPTILIIIDEIKKIIRSPIQIRCMEKEEKKRNRKKERSRIIINYKILVGILFIGTIILFLFNIPYISPGFWKNFSYNPYLYSGISYIIIQATILLIFSYLWLQNRYERYERHRNYDVCEIYRRFRFKNIKI